MAKKFVKKEDRIKVSFNEKEKIRNKNTLFDIIFVIIFQVLIIINSQTSIISNNYNKITLQASSITLHINRTGNSTIFCPFSSSSKFGESYRPNVVLINGKQQEGVNPSYYFNQTNNIVELIWNNEINKTKYMFDGCSNITYIDLFNFNSSGVQEMSHMFSGCSSLTSLNLSNFDASKVNLMTCMFEDRSSLTSLNLSNFNNENARYVQIQYIFRNCKKLEYINLKNFQDNKLYSSYNSFDGLPNNVVICTNETNIRILDELNKSMLCYTIDCSDNWRENQKKLVDIITPCKDDEGKNIIYKYEFKGDYFENCINGTLFDKFTSQECNCDKEKCSSCPTVPLSRKLCEQCNNDYYPMENDVSNIEEYVNCYKDPNGYYLDESDSLYKKCYYTCDTCEKKGDNKNHNCLTCDGSYSFEIINNNYKNCYKSCNNYYYFDNDYNYHCTDNSSCPDDYPILLDDNKQCVKNNNTINTPFINSEIFTEINSKQIHKYISNKEIKEMIEKIPKNNTKENKEEEIKYYDKVLYIIESIFKSGLYNTTNIDNGIDDEFKTEKMNVILTTTENQIINKDNTNITIINLAECESLLRGFYNISNDSLIYLEIIEVEQKGMKIPKVEFNVFSKISEYKIKILNLSLCENKRMYLSVSANSSESIGKLNSSGEYYNNICNKAKSDKGTDITIKDRQKEFIEKDMTVCQDDCYFYYYNFETQKANCSCKIKEASDSFIDMTINKTKLYENFDDNNDKNKISNLDVTSCNVFDSKENIESNPGFFLLLLILALFIIVFIIFCSKGYNDLENKIDEVIHKKFKNEKNPIKDNKIKTSELKQNILTTSKNKKHKTKNKAKKNK